MLANLETAKQMRAQLVRGTPPPASFRAALADVAPTDRDAWVDLLLNIHELPDDGPDLPRGCAPYLPCPVATVTEAVRQAGVTSRDVFVDVGSGLGRTVALVHLLTGAGCIGLEVQSDLARLARSRAAWLNLSRARVVEGRRRVHLLRGIGRRRQTFRFFEWLRCRCSAHGPHRYAGNPLRLAITVDVLDLH